MTRDPRPRACKVGYAKAKKLAERENKKLQRDAQRDFRAQEKLFLKAEADWHKVREAEGALIELPALVQRDGTVRAISLADACDLLEFYFQEMCLDCETSGYWLGHEHYELRTVQLGGEDAAVVFDALDSVQREVISWALKSSVRLRAHSATADVCPVVDAGMISWDEAWDRMQDSVLDAKLSDPKLSGSDADGLKKLAWDLLREYAVAPAAEKAKNDLFKAMGRLAKTEVTTPPERNGWYCVNRFSEVMIRYAGSDVLDLGAVLRALPELPVSQEVVDREREVQAICAGSAMTGFPLDLPHIQAKITEFEGKRVAAQARVAELTQGRVTNPSSSKEVLETLTDMGYQLKPDRKTKQPSAGKESLEPIAALGDELTKNILEYRHDVTTLGLLLRPLENLCLHGDGVMRPTVYTINAVTGRMSATRPNSQQFSRQGGVRACVRCWAGYRGISADYSGCELIVAAALSGDKGLYEAETSSRCHACGEDPCGCSQSHTGLHWLTAHTAYGINATKEDRYNAKRGTFTRLFGGSPATAAAQVGTDVVTMEKLFEAFSQVAPAYVSWDAWLRDCYRQGSVVWRDYGTGTNFCQPVDGSRRLIYRTYSGRNVYVTKGEHAAGNGAIQGTARELLVDGLLEWKPTPWGHLPVMPVHDQIISMVPEADAQEATRKLAECMSTDVLSSPGFPVHVGVDVDEPWVSWPDSS